MRCVFGCSWIVYACSLCGYWCMWETEVCLEHLSRSFFILYIEAASLNISSVTWLVSLVSLLWEPRLLYQSARVTVRFPCLPGIHACSVYSSHLHSKPLTHWVPSLAPPIIRGLTVQKPPLILQLSLNFLVQASILSLKQSFKKLGGFL